MMPVKVRIAAARDRASEPVFFPKFVDSGSWRSSVHERTLLYRDGCPQVVGGSPAATADGEATARMLGTINIR